MMRVSGLRGWESRSWHKSGAGEKTPEKTGMLPTMVLRPESIAWSYV